MPKMILLAACILFSAFNLSSETIQVFRGAITDSMCTTGHKAMLTSGESLPTCVAACVKRGAKYVLFSPSDKMVYKLDNQSSPAAFAATNVVVIGMLDKVTSTIHVSELFAALPPKVVQAKTIYVDCDGCVRGMAKAPKAALQQLADWNRFKVVSDPRKADLVLLLSANPYLGDYATRDSADKRVVNVDVTFMNVLDPHTGASLWGDSRKWGSWRVSDATKTLIEEFRGQLAAQQEGQVEALVSQGGDNDSVNRPGNGK